MANDGMVARMMSCAFGAASAVEFVSLADLIAQLTSARLIQRRVHKQKMLTRKPRQDCPGGITFNDGERKRREAAVSGVELACGGAEKRRNGSSSSAVNDIAAKAPRIFSVSFACPSSVIQHPTLAPTCCGAPLFGCCSSTQGSHSLFHRVVLFVTMRKVSSQKTPSPRLALPPRPRDRPR